MQYYRHKSLIFSYFFTAPQQSCCAKTNSNSLPHLYLQNTWEMKYPSFLQSVQHLLHRDLALIEGMNKEIFLFVLLAMSIPHLIDVHHYEQCDIGGLQDLLDGWCKDQTGTTTYYPAYKQYILINWDEFEGE